jgi:hypothetical protein
MFSFPYSVSELKKKKRPQFVNVSFIDWSLYWPQDSDSFFFLLPHRRDKVCDQSQLEVGGRIKRQSINYFDFQRSAFIDGSCPFRVSLVILFRSARTHISVHKLWNTPTRDAIDLECAHSFVNFRFPLPAYVENGGVHHVDLHAPPAIRYYVHKWYVIRRQGITCTFLFV